MVSKDTGISIELAMSLGTFIALLVLNIGFIKFNIKKIEEDISDINGSMLDTIESEKNNMWTHIEEKIDKINSTIKQNKQLVEQRVDHLERKIHEVDEKHRRDIEDIKKSKNGIAERLFNKTDAIREDLNKAMLNIEKLRAFANNDNKRISETMNDIKERINKLENMIFKHLIEINKK